MHDNYESLGISGLRRKALLTPFLPFFPGQVLAGRTVEKTEAPNHQHCGFQDEESTKSDIL